MQSAPPAPSPRVKADGHYRLRGLTAPARVHEATAEFALYLLLPPFELRMVGKGVVRLLALLAMPKKQTGEHGFPVGKVPPCLLARRNEAGEGELLTAGTTSADCIRVKPSTGFLHCPGGVGASSGALCP